MFRKLKYKETKRPLNNKGFSLIEILIAVGILALIIVPLAMNMITGAQLNSKSKQVAASSDLTTSLIEMMQTVDLSDILTDVNGYTRDEYGTELAYTMTKTALKNYDIEQTMEVIKSADGKTFTPVTLQEDVLLDYLVTSSINTRDTEGGVKKAYFTGQESGEYAFLLRGVETDENYVDVLVTITPKQKIELVNITSMAQSEVIYTRQDKNMNNDVAKEFEQKSNFYASVSSNNVQGKSASWFLENMERTIEVTIDKDTFSESTTIKIYATYTSDTDALKEADRTIVKKLGSFTTNSTAEYSRGIYLYYYPLEDTLGTSRDSFIVTNENEFAVPVYLIAMAGDAALDLDTMTNYHPSIHVAEKLNDGAEKTKTRTTICSNVNEERWNKSVYPSNKTFEIKSIGNASWQQTLYSASIQVYSHRDEAYNEDGVFTPSDKYLLVETSGTFVDRSEILDITSDSQAGTTATPGAATAGVYTTLVYDGDTHKGVWGNGVVWSGTTEAINAGTYTAEATPLDGYFWQDGSNGKKTYTWSIAREATATVSAINHVYCAEFVTGVQGQYVEYAESSVIKAKNVGNYTVRVTPDSNHAWEDGSYGTKTIKWRINKKELVIVWATGEGKDVWNYDGQTHYASCQVLGVFDGDTCDVTLINDSIKDVGTKETSILNINNSNYRLPDKGWTHVISVVSAAAARVEPQEEQYLVYDGTVKEAVRASVGVYFTGTPRAKDAGTYQYTAHLKDGYTWAGGMTGSRTYTWTLFPREADLTWGENTWVYNGAAHSTTCVVANTVYGDSVTVTLEKNSITDVGKITTYAVALSNKNYVFAEDKPGYVLEVTRAPLATVNTYDFEYDGNSHTGVVGQYIIKDGDVIKQNVKIVDNQVTAYTCKVTPMSNYCWADNGKSETRTVTWSIYPIQNAFFDYSDMFYCGETVTGIWRIRYAHKIDGDISGLTPGEYTARLEPDLNYSWKENPTCSGHASCLEYGCVEIQTVSWEILNATFKMPQFEDSVFTYNGEVQIPTLMAETVTDGAAYVMLAEDYTDSSTGIKYAGALQATNAGKYNVTIKLKDTNAKWADGTTDNLHLTWEILPKEVGISWQENSWTYDSEWHYGKATCTGLISGDVCNFTYSNNARHDWGTQPFTITGTDNPNYKIPSSGLSNNMTISRREVGVVWGQYEWTYDGASHTVDPTPTNVVGGDSCDFLIDNSTTVGSASRTDAGTTPITITGLTNDNYQLPSSNLTCTLKINRSPTATASPSNKTYNGSEQTGVIGSYVSWSGTTKATNANTYTAYATPTSNYAWSDGTYAQKPITWTMDKAAGSVSSAPTNKNPTYTGSAQAIINAGSSSTGTMMYSLDGTNYSSSLPTATNATDRTSGTSSVWQITYTVYYYSKGDSNHYDTEAKTITATIAPKKDATYSKTTSFTYDGTEKEAIHDMSNTVRWNAVKTNAGTYTATAIADRNHAFSDGKLTQSFSFTINKATVYKPSGYTSTNRYYIIYDGSERSIFDNIYNGDCMKYVSGTQSATNYSNNYVTVAPDSNHTWTDGTTDNVTVYWRLEKAPMSYWTHSSLTLNTMYSSTTYSVKESTLNKNYSGATWYDDDGTAYVHTPSMKGKELWAMGNKSGIKNTEYAIICGYIWLYVVPSSDNYAWSMYDAQLDESTWESQNMGASAETWQEWCDSNKYTYDGWPYFGRSGLWSVMANQYYDTSTNTLYQAQ